VAYGTAHVGLFRPNGVARSSEDVALPSARPPTSTVGAAAAVASAAAPPRSEPLLCLSISALCACDGFDTAVMHSLAHAAAIARVEMLFAEVGPQSLQTYTERMGFTMFSPSFHKPLDPRTHALFGLPEDVAARTGETMGRSGAAGGGAGAAGCPTVTGQAAAFAPSSSAEAHVPTEARAPMVRLLAGRLCEEIERGGLPHHERPSRAPSSAGRTLLARAGHPPSLHARLANLGALQERVYEQRPPRERCLEELSRVGNVSCTISTTFGTTAARPLDPCSEFDALAEAMTAASSAWQWRSDVALAEGSMFVSRTQRRGELTARQRSEVDDSILRDFGSPLLRRWMREPGPSPLATASPASPPSFTLGPAAPAAPAASDPFTWGLPIDDE